VIQSVTGVLGADDVDDQDETQVPGSASEEPAASSPDVSLDGSVSSTNDVDEGRSVSDTGTSRIQRAVTGITTDRHYQDECPNCEKWITSRPSRGMSDRYDRFGYECRVEISGDRYTTGAENIAYTRSDSNVQTESGLENYGNNETAIARGLVNQWMNSSGHRENILRSYWQSEGIGVAIEDVNGETRVYATQNFC
jgi:ribosomal protein L37AE/L43A